MHQEAFDGIKDFVQKYNLNDLTFDRALDIGGQDVNSSIQGIHPHTLLNVNSWDVLDIADGPGVTIVADGVSWRVPDNDPLYDLVLTTETLEHVENYRGILSTSAFALKAGGVFLGTWASTGRHPHAAEGGPDPFVLGEHYRNVSREDVEDLVAEVFSEYEFVYRENPGDLYLYGIRA